MPTRSSRSSAPVRIVGSSNTGARSTTSRSSAPVNLAGTTNNDVRPGATTTGRAGSQSASENNDKIDTINLVIPSPTVSSSVLRYPSDPPLLETSSDYVVFEFYKYAPPFGGGRDTPNQANARNSTTARSSGGYANYQNSNDRSYANKSSVEPIILYMPEDIQSQFGAGWNGAGFGAAAAGLMTAAGSVNTQKDLSAIIQALPGSIAGGIKAASFNALVSGINAAAGANINLNQALGTITGTIINPNVELAYESPKLRTFSLKFKLVPRTKKEAEDIRKICNRFKKAMLPSFGGQAIFGTIGEAPNLITIPDLCQVSFMHEAGLHPYLPKYKLCGITDVNINYTAAGAYSTVGNDGSPTATELTVSFLESKLVFSQEVQEDGSGI